MSNLNSTSDIKKQVLKNCGELQDGSSAYDQDGTVLDYINDAYLKVMAASNPYDVDVGEPWSWAKSAQPKSVYLKPFHENTATITNSSANGTLGSTPSAALGSFEGWHLKFDNYPEVFRILTHTAGTTAVVLDETYEGTTRTAGACRIFKIDYAVGSATARILRVIGPFYTESNQLAPDIHGKIPLVDDRRFREDFPMSSISAGTPTFFTIIHEVDGIFTVRFNRYPLDEAIRVEVPYIPMPSDLTDSDNSIPLIPREHRCVLEYAASHRLMVDKEDDKVAGFLGMTQAQLRAMMTGKRKTDHEASGQRGNLIARMDLYGSRQSKFGR